MKKILITDGISLFIAGILLIIASHRLGAVLTLSLAGGWCFGRGLAILYEEVVADYFKKRKEKNV